MEQKEFEVAIREFGEGFITFLDSPEKTPERALELKEEALQLLWRCSGYRASMAFDRIDYVRKIGKEAGSSSKMPPISRIERDIEAFCDVDRLKNSKLAYAYEPRLREAITYCDTVLS